MPTTVAYVRISSDKTGAGLGVERQAADCRELATRLGLGEVEILKDNDLSAYSGKPRPDYEELKKGLREGRWTTLLIWHVDRLCRSVRDLEDMVDLINGKVAVHTVRGGEIDLTSAEGRLQARMLGTLARYESEHRSDRVRRKMDANAEAGIAHGWQPDGTLEPAEAEIVAELTRRVVTGESIRALAADLRKREVPSSRGAVWQPGSVKSIVLRARNAGLREHRGQVVGAGTWPAIVDRDTWETACAVLTDPARRTSPGNAPTRLLSGLMTCGVCEAPVRAGGAKGGVPVYRCSTGGHVKRRVALVDSLVESFILDLLDREGVHPQPADVPDLRGEIAAVETRLANLEDDRADGNYTPAGYRRNFDRLTARLDDLVRRDALARVPEPTDDVTPASWPDLVLERKRAVVARKLQVRLLPAGGNPHFNAELIEITPRS